MRTVMLVVAGMVAPNLAWADLPVVQGQSLAKRAESDAWVDRTFTLQDRFAQRVSSLTPGQESLGFNKDEHLGIWLSDSNLPVFLPRTEAHETLLKALKPGDRISVTGVLRNERYRKPTETQIVGDIDVTISYRATVTRAVDARVIKRGWAQDPLATNAAAPAAGQRARVRVAPELVRYSRGFTVAETTLGLSVNTAVKLSWQDNGPFASGDRGPDLLNALTTAEKGDQLELWLRALPPAKGQTESVLILDRVRVLTR
jgi:hypothetical protein